MLFYRKAVEDAVERKRPLTRAVLEQRIDGIQRELDGALERHAFEECGPLQEKLDELIAKRNDLPTIDELRSAVVEAENIINECVKNKDFAGAADGQNNLEKARQRLADVLAADTNGDGLNEDELGSDNKENSTGIQCRVQLEHEIAELSDQIKKAIEGKAFAKASSLQKLLDEREGLRRQFPSAEELEAQLSLEKAKLEDAVSKKDFSSAEQLNSVISVLERKIEVERTKASELGIPDQDSKAPIVILEGRKKSIESRAELEDLISSISARVSEAVDSKNFKKADELQADVDKLVALREAFPTLGELNSQLQAQKNDMASAVSNKQFAKAEELNALIEKLEERIKKEKSVSSGLEVAVRSAPEGLLASKQEIASVKTSPAPRVAKAVATAQSAKSAATAPVRPIAGPPMEVGASSESTKPVRKLRPAKPVTACGPDNVVAVAKFLASKRANASVIVDSNGRLAGILTDTDFTRRVVAKRLDPAKTNVADVMTPHPTCVSMADSAMSALTIMVENHFRHLPVVDHDGQVAGLLDISKCLGDAIAKLENADEHTVTTAEEAVKQVVSKTGTSGIKVEALQALISSMSHAFGDQALPTLRRLLKHKPNTVISPSTTIRDAGIIMSEHRHSALIVENNKLVGVFGFKDMMCRAIARELPLDSTPVRDVMTPDPEAASPDITVLEALQIMFDHKFLTLPVCEDDGRVVGVVDVMDLMYGCGGTEGWRSIFNSAMEVDDDVSDVSSGTGFASSRTKQTVAQIPIPPKPEGLQAVTESHEERPVSKLRPSKPIIMSSEDSVLRTVKKIASKRASSSIIVNPSGVLVGILTDKDVTRRVVARNVEASSTPVSSVMTPNPIVVSVDDAAMEALTTMVENRFRYLPVVDEEGSVSGLLDIAKCLSSVIRKLERSQDKSSHAEDVLKEVVNQHGANGVQAAALQALLGGILSKAMGGTPLPTLRSILHGKPGTIVRPTTTIRKAGLLMAEHAHAALVVDDRGSLVGVFGFKDMLTRAVAKELPLDSTPVEQVMTPDPETATPDITVLDALQIMSDNKFLTLPVCEENGEVVGVVDVMDVIYGCGGTEGWRSILNSAMDLADDQTSVSGRSRDGSVHSHHTGSGSRRSVRKEKTVAKLRPSKPNLSLTHESILSVSKFLKRKRGDASLVVQPEGSLAGILTDTDFTRRVVAKNVDPATTSVSTVMTPNPTCVSTLDSAMDALTMMVENHFRHLPVVDGEGSVVGLLDIGKCLNDAIATLEREAEKGKNAAEEVLKQVVNAGDPHAAAIQSLLGSLVAKAMGDKALPTLRSMLQGRPNTVVSPTSTIREAGILMAVNRHAALIVENGRLVGIFGFKDMMSRAIANELPLDTTAVSEVMTPDPESVLPDVTVLEALQTMYDHKFLTLPVCEENGEVIGVVDVMDVIYGCGGSEGWRSIFSSAMELDYDESLSVSRASMSRSVRSAKKSRGPHASPKTPFASSIPPGVPKTLEFEGVVDDNFSYAGSTLGDDRRSTYRAAGTGESSIVLPGSGYGIFKITDLGGNTHRVKCPLRMKDLIEAVVAKASTSRKVLQLQYTDDEGDVVIMTSDDDVVDAWELALKEGAKYAKLSVVEASSQLTLFDMEPRIVATAGAAVIAIVGLIAFVVFRPSRKS